MRRRHVHDVPVGQRARGYLTTVGGVARDLIDGVRVLRHQPVARALLPVTVIFMAANASLTAVLIPLGVQRLGGTEHTGFLLSCLGAGFLIGAPVLRWVLDRAQPRNLLTASLTATAAAFFLLFSSSSLATALPAAVGIGLFGSMCQVIPLTAMQRVIPNAILGRVSAVFLTAEAAATLAGCRSRTVPRPGGAFQWRGHRGQPRHAQRGGDNIPNRAADACEHPHAVPPHQRNGTMIVR